MTTAIIGVGNIGGKVARHLVAGGEHVVLAARSEAEVEAAAKKLGQLASAAPIRVAIADAEVTTPRPHSSTRTGMHAGAVMARSISNELRRDADRPPLRLLPDSGAVRHRFRGGLPGGALRRVRAYIDDHIGERISLAELGREAGVSRFHFARQFRLSTGESPMGYLRRARIERSKSILQTRDATIAEVAARLGFSDQSHFTRTFGRLVGVSPGSFARSDDWRPAVAGERA